MQKKVNIIGSGFSSLSAACYLAQAGCQVSVFEKNESLGGRARQMKKEGFTFDMGPSWYWMPDIFERFFQDFGKSASDYYGLKKLNPAYKIYYSDDIITIADTLEGIYREFERVENGSAAALRKFLEQARINYDIAMNEMVYKPGLSPLELISRDTLLRADQFFRTLRSEVWKKFRNPKLRTVLEFPVLFLGAKPGQTPAFYNFMNYADFGLGTWHPEGGMNRIVQAMVSVGKEMGVEYHTGSPVDQILVKEGRVNGIRIGQMELSSEYVLGGADYHHTETLLEPEMRQYSEAYWENKTFAPSSLIFYVGFNKKLEGLAHHNLFFDTDFDLHAQQIYVQPKWPTQPLFYANFPSISDPSMAPEGRESGFFLIPIAPDLEDSPALREQYFDILISRLEARTGEAFREHILFRESFCVRDFKESYNSYKGNAYGLANTLRQTAFLRPGLKSSKVKGLYFTGQLTVPGPGIPPALISGKIVSRLIIRNK